MPRLSILLCCTTALLVCCCSLPSALATAPQASTTKDDLLLFRNIFYTWAKRSGLSDQAIQALILMPTDDLITASDTAITLDAVDNAFEAQLPSVCLKNSYNTPMSLIDVDSPFKRWKTKPLTIVIVPGMAGEFIPRDPYDEAYNSTSFLANVFDSIYSENPWSYQDSAWDTGNFSEIPLGLDELFALSSVDDPHTGLPLVQYVWVRPHEGSMETLQLSSETAVLIVRRLTKLLAMMKDYIGDMVLLGYSRGGPDVLEISAMVKNPAANVAWAKQLKGAMFIQGVLFGTPMADCPLGATASVPASLCTAFTDEIKHVLPTLQNLVPSGTSFLQNTAILNSAVASVAYDELQKPKVPQMDKIHMVWPSLTMTWVQIVQKALFETVDVWHLVDGYDTNIARAKYIGQVLTECVNLLSTSNRVGWWATHTLPADFFLGAVTGSQIDGNIFLETQMHPDEFLLRSSYYNLLMMQNGKGSQLNDGQVPVSREIPHPQIHMTLNPAQKAIGPYQAHWMGTLLSDHWGDTLPVVTPCPDGWTYPYPRVAVLQSFATFAAMKITPSS